MEISVQESELNKQINEETSQEEVTHNLATIQKIKSLSPIEGADRIELATMEDLAWQVVVQKGLHKIGDAVCYVQIDTVCPERPWAEFLKDRHYRVRTIKLKKQLSQGLIIPLRDLLEEPLIKGLSASAGLSSPVGFAGMLIGDDITHLIGVTKYEKPIPANLQGKIKGTFPTNILPMTDEERVQNHPRLVEDIEGLECYISIKMDGSSATYIHNNGETHVCSRTLSRLEPGPDDKIDVFWGMQNKYNILEKLKTMGNYAVQGEVCGPGIQGNKMGLKELDLFIFNVFNINEHRYLDFKEFIDFCSKIELKTVPIITTTIFKGMTVQNPLSNAEQVKYDNNTEAEGIVIRPVKETTSHAMRDARLSFKVLNNNFLLKYGE